MKLLYKYYRWRAGRATGEKQVGYRLKAYRVSPIGRMNFGTDLTFREGTKEDLIAQDMEAAKKAGGFPPGHPLGTIVGNPVKHAPGRYWNGEYDDNGRMVFLETPQWWADVKEANQQHAPTRLKGGSRVVSRRPRNDGSGRYDNYTYNYQTGKQEKID